MILARTYAAKADIPSGAEALYKATGNLFILTGAKRDFVADNPWEAGSWNLTAQGRFITEHGRAFASAFAKMAGTQIGATKPPASPQSRFAAIPASNFTVIVQRKGITAPVGGGGGGASSGDGPPSP